MTSLPDRAITRLKREAAKAQPVLTEARQHPRSQQLRRDLERARIAARLRKVQSPDALLDEIVTNALASVPSPTTPLLAVASVAGDPQERPEAGTKPEPPAGMETPEKAEPLRVGVVAPRSVPYVEGGAERHWASLVDGLCEAGMVAELVSLDCPEADLAQVLRSYRQFLQLEVSAFDVVISGKYPSWMVRHPRHIRHLNHPLRGLYERYPAHLPQAEAGLRAEVAEILAATGPDGLIEWALARADDQPFPGPFAQAVVQALDLDAAQAIRRHATVSEHVARRPRYLPPGVEVAVIPPLTNLATPTPTATSASVPTPAGRYLLALGRQTPIKRFDLTIAGFVAAKRPDLELRIAGDGPEHEALCRQAADVPGVIMLGHCTDHELQQQLASAIAVVATPEDEDFGLVAAEAHAVGRPVITTSDSGGVAEQVEHEVNGLVVRPAARSLGRAIKRLADDSMLANRLGRSGFDELQQRDWHPMTRLVREVANNGADRKRVLMLSTFPAEPVRGGGARRLRGVSGSLQSEFDVAVLVLTNRIGPGRVERRVLSDGVRQILVGRSPRHLSADSQMAALAGLPTDDIGCSVLAPSTSEWGETLELELSRADAVLLAHPFLANSLPDSSDLPVVYDAHNVEVDLKSSLLADCRGQARLRQWVVAAERTAVERASVVAATTRADAGRLHELYGGPIPIVAANGVDQGLLDPANDADREVARLGLLADLGLPSADPRPITIFVASNHPPNHAAADAIAQMAQTRPDLIVVLAGAHSERQREGVHNYGRFAEPTHRRLLLGSDIALNPVEAGSGTNLKLIEALAIGTPVVSTPVGARGLNDPDSVLFVATTDDLSKAIDHVLTDPLTPARVRAGRVLAKEHEWTKTTAVLKTALAKALGVPLTP